MLTVDVELGIGEKGATAALRDLKHGDKYSLDCLMGTAVFHLLARRDAFRGTDAQFDRMCKSFRASSGGSGVAVSIPGLRMLSGDKGFSLKGLSEGESQGLSPGTGFTSITQ